MSREINPRTARLPTIPNPVESIVSQKGGGIGSGLSGLTAGARNIAGNVSSFTAGLSNTAADISGALERSGLGSILGGVQSFTGKISSTAGVANNLLSKIRGSNLPAGGQISPSRSEEIKVTTSAKNDWRVRINCDWDLFGTTPVFEIFKRNGGMVFPYTPTLHIGSKANYETIDPVHTNYPIYAYKNSSIDPITITGEFSAETQEDAAYWVSVTTFFQTATKMFYGQGSNVGNPPVICRLSGYGPNVLPDVPIIITSFEVQLTPETDYVKCERFAGFGKPTWVPALSTITVTAQPIYSRSRLRQFDLNSYASGKLISDQGIGWM